MSRNNISKNNKNSSIHCPRNLGIFSRVKIVLGTMSEMVKIVSNVSMCMMQKTANMQNISGEAREIIWMSQRSGETLNGHMNVSILGLMLLIIIFVYKIGPAVITFIVYPASILMTISGAYRSKNITTVSSIHRTQLLNMKLLLEKS